MWEEAIDAISPLISGAGDLFGSAASGIGQFGSSLWNAALSNPWAAFNTGLSSFGAISPYLMGGGINSQGDVGSGLQAQMMQPQGPTPQAVRRNLSNAQAQGMYGASPDFLASQAGVTPDELEQMLGYRR